MSNNIKNIGNGYMIPIDLVKDMCYVVNDYCRVELYKPQYSYTDQDFNIITIKQVLIYIEYQNGTKEILKKGLIGDIFSGPYITISIDENKLPYIDEISNLKIHYKLFSDNDKVVAYQTFKPSFTHYVVPDTFKMPIKLNEYKYILRYSYPCTSWVGGDNPSQAITMYGTSTITLTIKNTTTNETHIIYNNNRRVTTNTNYTEEVSIPKEYCNPIYELTRNTNVSWSGSSTTYISIGSCIIK